MWFASCIYHCAMHHASDRSIGLFSVKRNITTVQYCIYNTCNTLCKHTKYKNRFIIYDQSLILTEFSFLFILIVRGAFGSVWSPMYNELDEYSSTESVLLNLTTLRTLVSLLIFNCRCNVSIDILGITKLTFISWAWSEDSLDFVIVPISSPIFVVCLTRVPEGVKMNVLPAALLISDTVMYGFRSTVKEILCPHLVQSLNIGDKSITKYSIGIY